MLNILHAQLYRLVRSVTFWGFLILVAVLLFAFASQTAVELARGDDAGFAGRVSSRFGSGIDGGVASLQDVLAALYVPSYIAIATAFCAASFFSDDFRFGVMRELDASPRFRRDYVASAMVIVWMMSSAFLCVGVVVVALAFFLGPSAVVVPDGAQCAEWLLATVGVSTTLSLLTLVIVVMTSRLGVAVLAAILLCGGIVREWVVGLAIGGPLEGLILPMTTTFPSLQLAMLCIGGLVPSAWSVLAWLAVSLLLCWLVIRRKRI